MESKVWIACERLITLITILVLAFAVWNTLLRVETEQAKQAKAINATLEKIRKQMGDDEEWRKAENSLKSNLPK